MLQVALGGRQAFDVAVKQHLNQIDIAGDRGLGCQVVGTVGFHGFEVHTHLGQLLKGFCTPYYSARRPET